MAAKSAVKHSISESEREVGSRDKADIEAAEVAVVCPSFSLTAEESKPIVDALRKQPDAAEVIGKQPIPMPLRFLQSLVQVSADNKSTIVLPVPIDLLRRFLT